MLWTVVQSDNAVGESLLAIKKSPALTCSVKNEPSAVTTYDQPCLILALGELSRSGVLVAALYPPWNINTPEPANCVST